MENKIVYVSENNGSYTKQDILNEINLWLSETNHFNQLTSKQLQTLKNVLYKQLLNRLEWTSPLTLLNEYEEDDIQELLNEYNN